MRAERTTRSGGTKTIRIGLFGFGKTGKLAAGEFLRDPRFELIWVVNRSRGDAGKYVSRRLGAEYDAGRMYNASFLAPDFFEKEPVDVLVDFSGPQGYRSYEAAAGAGVRIVTAISTYTRKDLAVLRAMARQTAVLVSPNITLGINFLLVASQVLQRIAPHADIEIIEEHFRDKQEVSGTAMKIAEVLGLEKTRHVNSIRVGGVVGKHEIVFGLPNQTIRLVHESINRAAFGQGAIFAAQWLAGK
ncbi:MAG: dihydrodipicolinate reductase C-terminal domain-containing protein, partial [Kiritimatiellae bacterium]|nr:dihydrodipicolinate reductase C-terminal domain-containing protein [Kiritimatiellia bacterium]